MRERKAEGNCYRHSSCWGNGEVSPIEIPHLWPGVHDVDEAAVVIGLHNGLQHALVLQASRAEPRQRLTAPAHGRLEEDSHNRCFTGAEGPVGKILAKSNVQLQLLTIYVVD